MSQKYSYEVQGISIRSAQGRYFEFRFFVPPNTDAPGGASFKAQKDTLDCVFFLLSSFFFIHFCYFYLPLNPE